MAVGNSYIISSLVFLIIICLVYYSKSRLKSIENNVYSSILIISTLGCVISLPTYFLVRDYQQFSIFTEIIPKLYLIYLIAWTYYISVYVLSLINLNNFSTIYEKSNKIFWFYIIFIAFITYILPMNYYSESGVVYTYGPSVNCTYAICFIHIVFWVIELAVHHKVLRTKKAIPMICAFIFAIIMAVVQKIDPSIRLMTPVISITSIIMYFTIENPDIKMLNEMYKNKELMEQGYEDKYNFLFEMTQEVRKPILDLNIICNEMRKEKLPQKTKEELEIISNLTRQLDFSINNVLNVSSFDIQKLKIINTKYDVLKICSGLEATINSEIKEGVKFYMTLPQKVPTLYGDYMKLRQILYSILNNACKNTDRGSVNLKLNVIEKYDFCRLIFNISDTGKGMSIDKINDLLSATGELDRKEVEMLEKKEFNFKICQKVIKIMSGNIMIKSNVGDGTNITITIDQRVYHENSESILAQYESVISDYRKVLVVSQNKRLLNVIKKKMLNHNISCSTFFLGLDAIDRVKAGKKFDFIIVDDEMQDMSGFMTFKQLKELKEFNIPTIIILKSDKLHIKEHYLEDGFSDYILIDDLDNELDRIIEKY